MPQLPVPSSFHNTILDQLTTNLITHYKEASLILHGHCIKIHIYIDTHKKKAETTKTKYTFLEDPPEASAAETNGPATHTHKHTF